MPLEVPEAQTRRGPPQFDDEEIRAIVDHVSTLGNGPAIPNVETSGANLTTGGELFRLNCAACHVASGSGAIIGGGRQAPSLMSSTPTEVGEAILIGPGAMPAFGDLDDNEVNDIAGYIADLQEQGTTDADALGGIGPVAEGLAAWMLGLVPLIALTRWIGTPRVVDEPAQPDTGANT